MRLMDLWNPKDRTLLQRAQPKINWFSLPAECETTSPITWLTSRWLQLHLEEMMPRLQWEILHTRPLSLSHTHTHTHPVHLFPLKGRVRFRGVCRWHTLSCVCVLWPSTPVYPRPLARNPVTSQWHSLDPVTHHSSLTSSVFTVSVGRDEAVSTTNMAASNGL